MTSTLDLSKVPAEWHDYARQYGVGEALERAAEFATSTEAPERERDTDEEVVEGEVVSDGPSYSMVPVLPRTGEAISLQEASGAQLAFLLSQIRAFESADLRTFKREITDELIDRMDAAVEAGAADSWTWHTEEGWTISADSPDLREWDVAELRGLLQRLIADGNLDPVWQGKVIVPDGYKVAKREVTKLLKLGGPVADAIKAIERKSSKPRAVTVKEGVRS